MGGSAAAVVAGDGGSPWTIGPGNDMKPFPIRLIGPAFSKVCGTLKDRAAVNSLFGKTGAVLFCWKTGFAISSAVMERRI